MERRNAAVDGAAVLEDEAAGAAVAGTGDVLDDDITAEPLIELPVARISTEPVASSWPCIRASGVPSAVWYGGPVVRSTSRAPRA